MDLALKWSATLRARSMDLALKQVDLALSVADVFDCQTNGPCS